jgi:hypothetical protein
VLFRSERVNLYISSETRTTLNASDFHVIISKIYILIQMKIL